MPNLVLPSLNGIQIAMPPPVVNRPDELAEMRQGQLRVLAPGDQIHISNNGDLPINVWIRMPDVLVEPRTNESARPVSLILNPLPEPEPAPLAVPPLPPQPQYRVMDLGD
jgi:hypothetical protein